VARVSPPRSANPTLFPDEVADSAPKTGGEPTVVYTDGACRGNPGPGGWAWYAPAVGFAYGSERSTTNQRMELTAVLDALRHLEGPLLVMSDSTYVVNCFRDGWWQGWLKRGWRNANRQPVANRDLWEPLIELSRARQGLTYRWVRGHSGDALNELVDQLAVRAAQEQSSGRGAPSALPV
jgi:ribonuclease HI